MIQIMSFGYKYGEPEGQDAIIDCRSIKNPYVVAKFKGSTWENEELQDYVIGDPLSGQKLWAAKDAVGDAEDFKIAFGCIGGQHRSVILAELFSSNLHVSWDITHRDLKEQ